MRVQLCPPIRTLNPGFIAITVLITIYLLWILIGVSKKPLHIHLPSYQSNQGTEGIPGSRFLAHFANPCYLSSHEEEVLGPFWSGRSYSRLLTRPNAVMVDVGNDKRETLRCLPYYFVLGWAKCGTTELATKMTTHPHITNTPVKEPSFFSSRRFEANPNKFDLHLKHADDYVDFFDLSANQMALHSTQNDVTSSRVPLIVGDHSTHTIDQWHSHENYTRGIPKSMQNALETFSNPQMIKYLNPHTKFIVLLRNPVYRFYSLYKMHEAISPQDFHDGIVYAIKMWELCLQRTKVLDTCLYTIRNNLKDQKPTSRWKKKALASLPKSLYIYFLEEWMSIFPKEQFLILRFEDFIEDTDNIINTQVFPFLGLPNLTGSDWFKMKFAGKEHVIRSRPKGDGTTVNHEYDQPMMKETKELLESFFAPYNEKLSVFLKDEKFKWLKDVW